MNLTHVETFVTILEEGSLMAAALRLDVAQSTVTSRLQGLERELGCQLVERSKGGAVPTAAGLRVRANATTIIDLWSQVRREAALAADATDSCALGCHVDAWTGAGDLLLDVLRSVAPHLAVTVRSGSIEEVASRQRNGLTDLSIAHDTATPSGHRRIRLGTDQLVLVATEPDAPIRFDPGYVFVDLGEEFVRSHAAAYTDAALAFVTFDSAVAGVEHVRLHGGSVYAPRRLVGGDVHAGHLHLIEAAPIFTRSLDLVVSPRALERFDWIDDVTGRLRSQLA